MGRRRALVTTLGDLDLLGEVTGGGGFSELAATAERVRIDDFECRLLSLPMLFKLKPAAGRGKDREALRGGEFPLDLEVNFKVFYGP